MHEQLEAILTEHADRLVRGDDASEEILHRYAPEREKLLPLLALARLLHETLVPLSAPADFARALGSELREGELPEEAAGRARRAGLVAAAVGSLLSVAGVVLLIRRRLQARDEAVTTPAV